MRRLPLALPLLTLVATAVSAQTARDDFTRILLPISLPVPVSGAFGSSWSTETLLFNDSDAAARLVPGCEPASDFCDVGPRATLRLENFVTSATRSRARVVYVAKAAADAVHFVACLRQGDGCTPLPVVREAAFRPRIVLPFVPLGAGRRGAVRIYGDAGPAIHARIRIFRLDRLDPLVDESILLGGATAGSAGFDEETSFFAATDLLYRWPQLQVAASVRVEIQSLDGARRVWAFASVTDNTTEQVQLFAPDE